MKRRLAGILLVSLMVLLFAACAISKPPADSSAFVKDETDPTDVATPSDVEEVASLAETEQDENQIGGGALLAEVLTDAEESDAIEMTADELADRLKQLTEAGYIGVCGVNLKEETAAVYVLKNPEEEIHLSEISAELTENTLPIYVYRTEASGRIMGSAYDLLDQPLAGITSHSLDHEYLLELLKTDPKLKAACEFAGISNPELYFRHTYD